jgi:hypothetical protein
MNLTLSSIRFYTTRWGLTFHHDQERGTTYPNGINELPESGQRREVVPRYPHPKGWERDHLHETETPDEELEAFDPADVF